MTKLILADPTTGFVERELDDAVQAGKVTPAIKSYNDAAAKGGKA